jgi:acetoin utilization deacetylase AcuC-like enzyme
MKCFYHPAYFFPLPQTHPFPMEKFPQAYARLSETCPALRISSAEPVPYSDLLRVHTRDYLRGLELGMLAQNRTGFELSSTLFQRCRLETGGTISALEAALAEGLAANLAGGTHHAFPDRGAGFCLLNDVAVAIRVLRTRITQLRVLVIDTDAHQGDGTHFIFRDDPLVFTYSIHVGKNYPSRKEPGDLDVPLARFVSGEVYLAELRRSLPMVVDRFNPDVLIWVSGVDPHENDRFGQMQLRTEDLSSRDRFILELYRTYEIPMAILFGGGYNRAPGETGRLHAATVALAYHNTI